MKKKYAIITDIHGNIEGLNAILNDIKKENIDEIFCLGDTIGIGPKSKECLDKLIELNVKMTLGNHELRLLEKTNNDSLVANEEQKYYEWVKESLTNKEFNFIKSSPLYYEINIDFDNKIGNKKIILCHYLIKNQKSNQPFEQKQLKDDINLWIKYNDSNIIYLIGHLHKSFDVNEVDGISGDYIEQINELTNIEIVDSAGCSYDEYVSYMILEIDRSISFKRKKVRFDRNAFLNQLNNTNFPNKKNFMKFFVL